MLSIRERSMKSKQSLGAISVATAVLASAMLGAISGLLVARPTNAHAAVGDITEYSAPTPASEPIGIASGPDSNLWVTESGGNEIAKVTTSGVFTEYSVPTTGSSPFGIAVGPDNNLWFTENSANKVGAITTSGDFREFSVPTDLSAPTLIAAGPDGNLWFTEQAANKVAKVTTTGVFSA